VLVLNKFPIIRDHFILATKAWKNQTDELEAVDLGMTYDLLKSWEVDSEGGTTAKRLFAFFNCGPESGASQPHRHIQFLPVESILEGQPDRDKWSLLIDSLSPVVKSEFAGSPVPFAHFSGQIPPSATASTIYSIYLSLLDRATLSWKSSGRDLSPKEKSTSAGFSYNLAMTTERLVVCPRVTEGVSLQKEDGCEIGLAAFNGTILAGTLMVKREEEWEFLRGEQGSSALERVLEGVGLPSRDIKVNDVIKGAGVKGSGGGLSSI
jgi:ATP adenylyltransferase